MKGAARAIALLAKEWEEKGSLRLQVGTGWRSLTLHAREKSLEWREGKRSADWAAAGLSLEEGRVVLEYEERRSVFGMKETLELTRPSHAILARSLFSEGRGAEEVLLELLPGLEELTSRFLEAIGDEEPALSRALEALVAVRRLLSSGKAFAREGDFGLMRVKEAAALWCERGHPFRTLFHVLPEGGKALAAHPKSPEVVLEVRTRVGRANPVRTAFSPVALRVGGKRFPAAKSEWFRLLSPPGWDAVLRWAFGAGEEEVGALEEGRPGELAALLALRGLAGV